jgi:oligoendopeptidase F
MNSRHCLDLDSRMHKGMGGYNLSMPESGVPFIFMNSTNSEEDVITMVHESGHAFHSFLSHPLQLSSFKDVPSEVAEVASMSMEMVTMDNWDVFYPNPEDLRRAKLNYLQYAIYCLPRICHGDSFQFWLYENPNHTVAERRAKWLELNARFVPDVVDWTGCETAKATGYNRILHFFIVPFYFIEYGFAELGAMAIWKNYKQHKGKAISDYKQALSLGYTKTIPEFYSTAGARFDFSEGHIAELIGFMVQELESL